MAKLEIIYKNEKDGWTHEEDTELGMDIYTGNSTLYIGMKETRMLKEMAEGVEKELKRRTLLEQDKKLEISDFDKYIIEFEQEQKERVEGIVYDLAKIGYEQVEQGRSTWEYFLNILKESRCSECM